MDANTDTKELVTIDEQTQRKAHEAEQLPATYENFEILGASEFEGAGETLKEIKDKSKALDDMRKSITRPLDDSKKRIMDFFRKPADALKKAEGFVKAAMLAYSDEQENKRLYEESRLRFEQAKEAARLERLAEKAKERGAAEKAREFEQRQAIVEQAVVYVEPIAAPKVAGISGRETWMFDIVDASLIPREYLTPNMALIGQTVRAQKGKIPIPGIRIFPKKTLSAGRA